jgi:GPI ethanolamine phosphate transferase 2/3 subunit F
LALTAFSVPVLHILFVLFGAPFLTHVYHTLLCAGTLAVLSVFPVVYAHGVNPKAWTSICGATAPWDEIFCGFWGGIIGAWLGAVPIPLDWDREWQKWPVTIVCGIFVGYMIGRVVGNVTVANWRLGAKDAGLLTAGEGTEARKTPRTRTKKD